MFNKGLDDSRLPLARRLAELAVAAELFETIIDGAGPAKEPAMELLLAYARRAHDAPTDSAIERAIRTDPAVSRRYRDLLAILAQAVSPVAYAAASEEVPSRTIGKWHLRVAASLGLLPVLVLKYTQQDPAPALAAIEAVGTTGESVRLPLFEVEPINQAIQLPLYDDFPKLAAFHRLLKDTDTEIFLL
jgi:hypothetical protein